MVHLQLRHFVLAGEALRDASQTVDLVERYFSGVTESDKLVDEVRRFTQEKLQIRK